MKIGFTGTRTGMTQPQRVIFIELTKNCTEFHHGCCVGADETAGMLILTCLLVPARVILHPPIITHHMGKDCYGDEVRPAKSFHVRDRDIVDETEMLIATPKGFVEELRSGTWTTIRYARKVKKPIFIIQPDGNIIKENIDSTIKW